jgi:crotonobetainyl-CoA:carnitine CoA-transferase CaiB-like acyl-CoA transferase
VSITAAGRAAERVGFGDDVAAGAGLVAWTDAGTPVFVGDAIADPLTGLAAAVLAMTAPGDGAGVLWDLAMADVVAATLSPSTDPGAVPAPSPAARRVAGGFVLEGPDGLLEVAQPRHRPVPAAAPPPGAHTHEVLAALGIARR